MRAVDTNVLVRLLFNDHPRQSVAAEAFVAGGAWISLVVIVETVWVLETSCGFEREQLAAAVELLLGHRSLSFQDEDVIAAALQSFRTRGGVSFSDCLILECARKAGHVPLGTFDRDLARLSDTELLRAAG